VLVLNGPATGLSGGGSECTSGGTVIMVFFSVLVGAAC